MTRTKPSLKIKLASALLQIVRYDDENAEFVPVIPYEEAKTLTADQIIARFHFDHGIAHAHGGPALPWNLTPMAVEDHREKTAKIDVPRIAKGRRIRLRLADQTTVMAARLTSDRVVSRKPKRKIPSRPFPNGHRPLRSRGFQ